MSWIFASACVPSSESHRSGKYAHQTIGVSELLIAVKPRPRSFADVPETSFWLSLSLQTNFRLGLRLALKRDAQCLSHRFPLPEPFADFIEICTDFRRGYGFLAMDTF